MEPLALRNFIRGMRVVALVLGQDGDSAQNSCDNNEFDYRMAKRSYQAQLQVAMALQYVNLRNIHRFQSRNEAFLDPASPIAKQQVINAIWTHLTILARDVFWPWVKWLFVHIDALLLPMTWQALFDQVALITERLNRQMDMDAAWIDSARVCRNRSRINLSMARQLQQAAGIAESSGNILSRRANRQMYRQRVEARALSRGHTVVFWM